MNLAFASYFWVALNRRPGFESGWVLNGFGSDLWENKPDLDPTLEKNHTDPNFDKQLDPDPILEKNRIRLWSLKKNESETGPQKTTRIRILPNFYLITSYFFFRHKIQYTISILSYFFGQLYCKPSQIFDGFLTLMISPDPTKTPGSETLM